MKSKFLALSLLVASLGFANVKAPIKEGDKLDATLEFDNGQKLEVKDIVAKAVVKKDGEHGHDHGAHDHGGHHKH